MNDPSRFVDADIKHVHLHSNYKPSRKYNDIALIELRDELKFTETVKPICLQTDNDEEKYFNFTIIGFGISDLQTSEIALKVSWNRFHHELFALGRKSDWLMKATVLQVSLTECQRSYRNLPVSGLPDGAIDTQVCASNNGQNRADACQGETLS